jgi:hypothetical protein
VAEPSLSELIADARGAPIEWDGRVVYGSYVLKDVEGKSDLSVQFVEYVRTPRQALRLKPIQGTLGVAGERLKDVVLWSDTAPRIVQVTPFPPRSRSSIDIRIWNAWWDGGLGGFMNAWKGNAGLQVDEVDTDAIWLRCSDGVGEPSFADLVVRIAAHRASITT